MFHNGKKTIGVFIQQVNEEYQNLLCRGISGRAKELDYNVAVFTNFGGYGQDAYDIGERHIVNLPDYERFDGIVIAPDTMHLEHLEGLYNSHISDKCICPIVSVRKERKQYYNVLVDNDTILEEIITHFIEIHNFTRINFLSGPKDFPEIAKRLETYRRILTEHGIPVEEDRIYYGDLWIYEGYCAVDHWLNSQKELPQAIVCANDFMAITVCKALAARSISVPGQIAVSGCDDIEEAEEFYPSITSARLPSMEMGIEAVNIIHRHLTGIEQPKYLYIKSPGTIYRASSGSSRDFIDSDRGQKHISGKKHLKYASRDTLYNEIARIAQMSTELAGATTLDDAIDKISRYWFEYESISNIYLCLRKNWDDYNSTGSSFPSPDGDNYIMESGLRDKTSFYKLHMPKNMLIHPDLAEDAATTYYFAVLHYQEHFLGYVAFSFKKDATIMMTLQAWLNNISSLLENVRMHMELKRLVYQLEDMSIRDELTGLYNRRVLDTLGKDSLEHSVRDNVRMMVFIADLDKLKFINDNYGHSKGDMALKVVADALRKAADDDEICIRLGGDEFMAIGMDYDDIKMTCFINRFVEELERFNKSEVSEFKVYASYGWNLIYPDMHTTIEECLFTADSRMYQQKYNKNSNNIMMNIYS